MIEDLFNIVKCQSMKSLMWQQAVYTCSLGKKILPRHFKLRNVSCPCVKTLQVIMFSIYPSDHPSSFLIKEKFKKIYFHTSSLSPSTHTPKPPALSPLYSPIFSIHEILSQNRSHLFLSRHRVTISSPFTLKL